jgi:site-specific recombinase XerC
MTTPSGSCLPLAQWPAVDRDAFLRAIRPTSLLADDAPGAGLRPNTLRRHRASYGRWLAFLVAQGQLDPGEAPGARATPERVRAYIAELQAVNASGTALVRLQSLAVVLGWLAPTQDWSWLRPLLARLQVRVRPVRDHAPSLRSSYELVALGHRLMAEAEQGLLPGDRCRRYPRPVRLALRYRDGLLLALLAHHPIRLHNLAALAIGLHLRREPDGWWLVLDAAETKTRRSWQAPLAAGLTAPLERYLQYWRPQLAGAGVAASSRVLWLAAEGTALSAKHLHVRVVRHTRAAFGKGLSPHRFRDALATTIAVQRPELIGIVTPLLGHSTVATAQKHYNRAGMTSAADAWHQVLEAMKERRAGESDGDGQRPGRRQRGAVASRGAGPFREYRQGAGSKLSSRSHIEGMSGSPGGRTSEGSSMP